MTIALRPTPQDLQERVDAAFKNASNAWRDSQAIRATSEQIRHDFSTTLAETRALCGGAAGLLAEQESVTSRCDG